MNQKRKKFTLVFAGVVLLTALLSGCQTAPESGINNPSINGKTGTLSGKTTGSVSSDQAIINAAQDDFFNDLAAATQSSGGNPNQGAGSPAPFTLRDMINAKTYESAMKGDSNILINYLRENNLEEAYNTASQTRFGNAQYQVALNNTTSKMILESSMTYNLLQDKLQSFLFGKTGDILINIDTISPAGIALEGTVHSGILDRERLIAGNTYCVLSASDWNDSIAPSDWHYFWNARVGYESREKWIQDPQGFIVRRVNDRTDANARLALDNVASYFLGKLYSFVATKEDNEYWYCNKVVWRCWKAVGIDLQDVNYHFIRSIDFVNSSKVHAVTWAKPTNFIIDFNNDGKMDIGRQIGGMIDIWQSSGTSFGFLNNMTSGTGTAEQLIIADFNGDGKKDLGQQNNGDIYVWISTGAGFEHYALWATQTGSPDVRIVADFNGDGKMDIGQQAGGNIYVWLSTGTGFDYKGILVTGTGVPSQRIVADFNGDGKADVAQQANGNIYVWQSTGTNFIYKGVLASGTGSPDQRIVADFNGDGKMDLAQQSNGNVYVWLANGTGFDYKGLWTNHTGTPAELIVADFNGDSKTDIAQQSGGNVYVWYSTGIGFNYAGLLTSNTGVPEQRLVADFNGDGKMDIAQYTVDSVYVWFSTGTGFNYQGKMIGW